MKKWRFGITSAVISFLALFGTIRLITGGAHCSSFGRCLVFTLGYFIQASLVVKYLHRVRRITLFNHQSFWRGFRPILTLKNYYTLEEGIVQ
ncbi:MAG: accessory gene regulator B family protein [Clostridia bacterium]|nr:accessory gene regulator B family protein [Clostridia bacterium]